MIHTGIGWLESNAPVQTDPELEQAVERFVRHAHAQTGFPPEIWERVGEVGYRGRPGVIRIPLSRASGRAAMAASRNGFYLVASNRFFIQWDPPGASNSHYYGPFDGDPREVLGLPAPSKEELARDLEARLAAAKEIQSFTERDLGRAGTFRRPRGRAQLESKSFESHHEFRQARPGRTRRNPRARKDRPQK
jgi:hypothetical protein